MNESDERKRDFINWLSTRPESVQRVGEKYPGYTCYRLKNSNPLGHYEILSYGEPIDASSPVTVTLIHGADSHLAGIGVFGIKPDELIVCGCGKWERASPDQSRVTKEYIMNEAKNARKRN